jgi:hypothetical protein
LLESNHGSYFFNQLAALQILVGDLDGAKATVQDYFTGIYTTQINEKGDQPKESARTHPYHYRGYNLCAMIVSFIGLLYVYIILTQYMRDRTTQGWPSS